MMLKIFLKTKKISSYNWNLQNISHGFESEISQFNAGGEPALPENSHGQPISVGDAIYVTIRGTSERCSANNSSHAPRL